jgi:outer membrane murein-binding lipoprotein Lpp
LAGPPLVERLQDRIDELTSAITEVAARMRQQLGHVSHMRVQVRHAARMTAAR